MSINEFTHLIIINTIYILFLVCLRYVTMGKYRIKYETHIDDYEWRFKYMAQNLIDLEKYYKLAHKAELIPIKRRLWILWEIK